MNVPDTVGVPEMVMVLLAHAALTPVGKPVAVPIPVATVVVCVILVSEVLMQSVGVDEAGPTVLLGVTTMVPVVGVELQPPPPTLNTT